MSPNLPERPVVMWSAEQATPWTWVLGIASAWLGGDSAPTRCGSVAVSKHGITIDSSRAKPGSRFLGWDEIDSIEMIGAEWGVANIRPRTGAVIHLGSEHLPRRRAAEASIERAALLACAFAQARAERPGASPA